MEHESFENAQLAAVLNEHFVCIKVDREERPDLDQIYMQAVQAMGGRGGWPMSVFLTPDVAALLRRHLLAAHRARRHARFRPGPAGRGRRLDEPPRSWCCNKRRS